MVFGQNRQEDMVADLLNILPREEIENVTEQSKVNLEPELYSRFFFSKRLPPSQNKVCT
jgi:hypothetical protein